MASADRSDADASSPRRSGARRQLSREQVVDAAQALTRERGLDGWSLRELASALGTWPNAIAYHVGGREAVVDAVVQRVVATMPNPPAELGWQEWFRELLYPAREIARAHPGVARRLARDGATVPAALPIMDRGVARLAAAGFGERAPLAYAALLNGAMLLIALDDDRSLAGGDGTSATRLLAMGPPPGTGDGWGLMAPWLRAWAEDPAANRDALYRFTVEALLAGLAAQLGDGDGSSGRPAG